VLLDGYLATRPLKQNDEEEWPPCFYALTATALYQAGDAVDQHGSLFQRFRGPRGVGA
jgi:hypothetical protein